MTNVILTDEGLSSLNELNLLVLEENSRQLAKWGIQAKSPFEWLTYLAEEIGEMAEAMSEHYYNRSALNPVMTQHAIDEAIQAATLALKIAEMYRVQAMLEQAEKEKLAV